MAHLLDPLFVQNLMRHAAGRGVSPVQSEDKFNGTQYLGTQYHVNKEVSKSGNNSKNFGKDLVEELSKKIVDI